MFARKFIDHVDTHADHLCAEVMEKIKRSDRCRELLYRVPAEEQKQSTREIYSHLTDWLLSKTDSVTEKHYVILGMRRAEQGVPFSQLFWAVCATREYFWEYTERETLLDEPADFWGGVRMLHSLDRFFDRVLYFVTIGYETSAKGDLGLAAVVAMKK